MEEEFRKEHFLAPSISDKQNFMSHVLINGRLCDKDLKTRGVQAVQLGVDSDAVFYGTQSSKLEFKKEGFISSEIHSSGSDTDNAPVVQQDYTSHPLSDEIDGGSLAILTPEKQESKKRHNSYIHLNKTSPKKPKKHKPKILDEKSKKKVHNAQASEFTPKTPLKRSTHMQHSKRSYVKRNISKEVSVKKSKFEHVNDSSKDKVHEHLQNSLCKRALKFLEKETQAEKGQLLSLKFDKKEEKRLVKQDAQSSSRVYELFETDCLTSLVSGCNNISSFPKSYKRKRNVRHLFNRRLNGTTASDCVKSLSSFPLKWRKKRSFGCTKRRIYASRSIEFKCSSSPSINLLEHLIDDKHHDKLANEKKEKRKRRNKVKSSLRNEAVKMIEEYLPQECLLQENERDMHSFVDFIAKFESLSIHHKNDQLVVRDQNVGVSIVPYNGKVNSSMKKKNKKALFKVDLDEESERAWLKIMDNNYEQGSEDEEYWERERQTMINRASIIISILARFQGERSFSRWKGSVMDSIMGTFLTQNVTDHLSSSAFMDLVARFPGKDHERSNKSPERATACLPLDLFPKEDVGMQRCGNKSIFKEINHKASISETERPIISASITNNQGSEIQSFRTKGDARKDKIEDEKNEMHNKDWDQLRKIHSHSRERNADNIDAVDWEAVRQATVDELAETIKKRGMNHILATKIKAFLDRVMRDHGSMDLEWLRDVPPKDAKDYLLSIHGIGLKSTECIRLLTLHHVAFPVDVNVARVTVRLGWVPLQPLPGGLQMHLLQEYPVMDNIQKYLYPRLCTLSHETLYELHYHLITFGKIFCTKKKPRCDGCPLSGQCKHYASLSASKRLALPAPEIKKKSNVRDKPIVEMPDSPENHITEFEVSDIEDFDQDHIVVLPDLNETPDRHESDDFHMLDEDIPTIRLNNKESNNQIEVSIHGGNKSRLVVQRGPSATPVPNYRGRLKSVHQVYELPDSHPILQQLQVDERDPKDPSPYLFAPWVVHEQDGKPRSSFPQGCSSSEVCREIACCSTFSNEENDVASTVSGTLMIPVRSANKGRFPLNGTYFQVNEVFADDESTNVPIYVPKQCLSSLPFTLLFCGANVTSTFRGLPMELINSAFSHGYFCNRGFNRETRLTTGLSKLFHVKTNSQGKKTRQTKEEKTKQSGGAQKL